ncbi:hypothetical protein ABW19_dt0205889 [Dactylella cylindrospora]|nr:hypothetical protein ABW19_dt0205889 [Dactylella cylindrospora]
MATLTTPRARKSTGDMNKSLPPLPPPSTMPATPLPRDLNRPHPRSVSYAVAPLQPESALLLLGGRRDASFDLSVLRRNLQTPSVAEEKPTTAKLLQNLIKTKEENPEPITDDPDEFTSPSWWAGRFMVINDRLRFTMPDVTQARREDTAFQELYDLCGENLDKKRILLKWWRAYIKSRENEGSSSRKAPV